MRGYRLDRKITIQENQPVDSAYGDSVDNWVTLAEVWAEVRDQTGREFFQSGPVEEVRRSFFVRFLSGVTPAHRVIYDGVAHDIRSVREIGRRDGLEILTAVVS